MASIPIRNLDDEVKRRLDVRAGDLNGERLLHRHRVVLSGTVQSRFAILNRLAAIPVVCRNGNLSSTLIVIQNWIAASENIDGRPRLHMSSQWFAIGRRTTGEGT